ncbi:nicalin-1 isoform X1 [Benincasa hispida]|uniref:nicalin-1 isoform X1 n=1 Tax=Benincasa hispida TaxID=102211 RepID=UPI0019009386|nr:nicalin-1 isoform X1 [Benincasa hispida]
MAPRKPREPQVLDSFYPILALVFILVACVELCDAATVVDVYRLIQYDISGVPFGSRAATLNHHASSLHFPSAADLSRSVLIIPLSELNITFLQECISQKKRLGGLLVLLPKIFDSDGPENDDIKSPHNGEGMIKNLLVELERLLIHSTIPYPVYFASEGEDIDAVLADVKNNDATGQLATATTGGYKLVVSAAEPRKLVSSTITNIQGWLPGLKSDGDASQLPTIAIVASYDTFGAAPELSVGSDSNGSGVVALLEIARLFSLLYSNPKTRGRYNLLFGLTSGGPYNYNGTHKWLQSFDHRLRESIDYAICLNSIGSWDDKLWLHVSKPPENAYIKQIFEDFSNVAEDLGFKVDLKHKKINISNPRVAWEHEQFSRLRVTAATLSELSAAPELLERTGGLADNRLFLNESKIANSIKLVAESIAKHIYRYEGKNIQVFADDSSLAVNPTYIRLWLDLLSRTPRVAPFLSKDDPFISALKKELEVHTHDVGLQHEVFDGMFTFYDSTAAKLHVYQVASVTFDLLLLLVLGSYLVLLFCFLVITTRKGALRTFVIKHSPLKTIVYRDFSSVGVT